MDSKLNWFLRCALASCLFAIVNVSIFPADNPRDEAISPTKEKPVEQWGVFELELNGPADGNPFVEVALTAEFVPQGQAKPARDPGNGLLRRRGRLSHSLHAG